MILRAIVASFALVGALGCAMGDDGVNRRESDGSPPTIDAGSLPGDDAGSVPGDDASAGCVEGASSVCMTSCGSIGSATCNGGRVGPCVPPVEDCDGMDQDCDGTVDENLTDRACSTACGGGLSRCQGGAWSACMGGAPRAETCDGTDEDCDGAIDDGLTRACNNACGTGMETCVTGRWQGCTAPAPRAETCDGTDENCDGQVDGIMRACASACGAGAQSCSAGAWSTCTAPMPAAETCNRRDDDCNGVVDNGFQLRILDPVPFAELTAQQPACSGPGSRLDVCNTAAKRWCHAYTGGCFAGGGAGPLQVGPAGARVVCLGSSASEETVSFATVSAAAGFTVDDTNIANRVASSAVHRYCRSRGFAAGVGPTEHGMSTLTLTCLPSEMAIAVDLPTSDLVARGCNPVADPSTLACSSAADNLCRARGDTGGYGPVEWNTTSSAIVCFRAL